MLIRVCCYCEKRHRLPIQPGDEREPDSISHGICPEAHRRVMEELDREELRRAQEANR